MLLLLLGARPSGQLTVRAGAAAGTAKAALPDASSGGAGAGALLLR